MDNKILNNPEQQEEELQLGPLLKLCYHLCLKHWWWFVLSCILCVCLSWLYQQRQQRVFQRQSVMLIEDSNNSSGTSFRSGKRGSNMNTLLELNGVSVGDNLKNEIFILSSKRLMSRVVEKLHLDIDYTTDENLHAVTLYGKTLPFNVLFESEYKGKMAQTFDVVKKDGNTVIIKGLTDKLGNKLADREVTLGQMTATPYGKLCIVRGPAFGKWENEEIHVSRLSMEKASTRFMAELTANEYDKETSLIVLGVNDANTNRADDILNTLYNTYKEDVVENKNRVALNTAKFIDERIQIIGRELSSVESQLASFKKRNQLVDFDKTSQAVLTETQTARQQSLQAETQLNVARYLNDYLHNHGNGHDLIPALNVGEASFNQQIAAYNDQMNKRNQMVANTSENNNVVRDMDRQLVQMRQAISSSLRSYVNSLELRLRDAKANENMLNGRISGAPDQEKQGLDIQRQQSLKEALYTYLLNKREEVALQQAINEANVRLVEGPIGNKQVSPRSLIIVFIGFIIGLFIPAFILWIRFKLDVNVRGRKDIEDATSIPILGEVPRFKNSKNDNRSLITDIESDAPVVEAFRILRFSLGYMRHDTQVMMTTSTTPGQGKSFVSRNMAAILAMAGKRVILVDADIRKGTLSHTFGHTFGLTTYLSDDHCSLDDIIRPDGLVEGVDFIPAGHQPPNPSELLMSDRLDHLVEELRKRYDYVIIDTTPMFSVADANLVARVTDTTLFVIRVGMQNRDILPNLERLYQEDRFKNLCIVLNDVDPEDPYKSSGYGYGYGYGYGAQNKKKGLIRRIRRK